MERTRGQVWILCPERKRERLKTVTLLRWLVKFQFFSVSLVCVPELMRFALVSQIQVYTEMSSRELNLEASRKRATSSALGAIGGCDFTMTRRKGSEKLAGSIKIYMVLTRPDIQI